eukprot:260901_1
MSKSSTSKQSKSKSKSKQSSSTSVPPQVNTNDTNGISVIWEVTSSTQPAATQATHVSADVEATVESHTKQLDTLKRRIRAVNNTMEYRLPALQTSFENALRRHENRRAPVPQHNIYTYNVKECDISVNYRMDAE